jgi:hypothetical protein
MVVCMGVVMGAGVGVGVVVGVCLVVGVCMAGGVGGSASAGMWSASRQRRSRHRRWEAGIQGARVRSRSMEIRSPQMRRLSRGQKDSQRQNPSMCCYSLVPPREGRLRK